MGWHIVGPSCDGGSGCVAPVTRQSAEPLPPLMRELALLGQLSTWTSPRALAAGASAHCRLWSDHQPVPQPAVQLDSAEEVRQQERAMAELTEEYTWYTFSEEAATKFTELAAVEVKAHMQEEPSALRPIFIVDVEHCHGDASKSCYAECIVAKTILTRAKSDYENALTVVLTAVNFASFTSDAWLLPALNVFAEYCDICLFAAHDELESVAHFFTQTSKGEDVARLLCNQQIAFPRLHFFTMKSALGQELDDGSILFPSLTVGSSTFPGNIPEEKYKGDTPGRPFFLHNHEWKPMIDRVLEIDPNAAERTLQLMREHRLTVMQPAMLIVKLLDALMSLAITY